MAIGYLFSINYNDFYIEDAIRESVKYEATHICIFTLGRMKEENWKVFEKSIYNP